MAAKLVFVIGSRSATISLAETLIKAGHRVAAVKAVPEALHLMASFTPSLIVLTASSRDDVADLVQGMAMQPQTIPFLLVSSDGSAGQWGREFGAVGFVRGVSPLLLGVR